MKMTTTRRFRKTVEGNPRYLVPQTVLNHPLGPRRAARKSAHTLAGTPWPSAYRGDCQEKGPGRPRLSSPLLASPLSDTTQSTSLEQRRGFFCFEPDARFNKTQRLSKGRAPARAYGRARNRPGLCGATLRCGLTLRHFKLALWTRLWWSGQVRFITRPKSRTMRAKRKKTFES